MKQIIYGIVMAVIGQVMAFFQLQGAIKYQWLPKYTWGVILLGLPISWVYIKFTQQLIQGFNGELWPGRLIGFAVGVIVFTALSSFLFKEPITYKTVICLLLSIAIVLIQIFWKS